MKNKSKFWHSNSNSKKSEVTVTAQNSILKTQNPVREAWTRRVGTDWESNPRYVSSILDPVISVGDRDDLNDRTGNDCTCHVACPTKNEHSNIITRDAAEHMRIRTIRIRLMIWYVSTFNLPSCGKFCSVWVVWQFAKMFAPMLGHRLSEVVCNRLHFVVLERRPWSIQVELKSNINLIESNLSAKVSEVKSGTWNMWGTAEECANHQFASS